MQSPLLNHAITLFPTVVWCLHFRVVLLVIYNLRLHRRSRGLHFWLGEGNPSEIRSDAVEAGAYLSA
jgi:hypothetical protein